MDSVSISFFVSELERRNSSSAVPEVKGRAVKQVKCEMEVLEAYQRHATLTGLTLLMARLASRQHILSSALFPFSTFLLVSSVCVTRR